MQRDDDAFDDRKKSQEAKYKMDEERRFKVRARRNKLLGAWAAERLGLSGSATEEFAREVVAAGLEARSDADLMAHLQRQVAGAGGMVEVSEIAERLPGIEAEATRQIAEEFPSALDTDHRQVGDGPYSRRS